DAALRKAQLPGDHWQGFRAALVFDPFRPRDVGEGTVEFSQPIKHDAAVYVGSRRFRIELDRMVEVGNGVVQVAPAVGGNSAFAKKPGVIRSSRIGRGTDIERRRALQI